IYLSKGDGTFAAAVNGPYRTIDTSSWTNINEDLSRIRYADFNGDGKTDIAAVEGLGTTSPMSIYLSNGDGTFQAATSGPSVFVNGVGNNGTIDMTRVQTNDFNA